MAKVRKKCHFRAQKACYVRQGFKFHEFDFCHGPPVSLHIDRIRGLG